MSEKSKNEASRSNGEDQVDAAIGIKRQRLVARVAGSVAAGLVTAPSKSATTAGAIAEISVDIAEEIVKRVGL